MQKIVMACDHAGFSLKLVIKEFLSEKGIEVIDLGCDSTASVDYPNYAVKLCEAINSGVAERGILICGTGIGMSIAANKCKGIRAACCSETFSARMTRMHNDANVLCLGARVVGQGVACDIVNEFVSTEFEQERHTKRVNMLKELDSYR